jgi:hypothetical protein
MEPHMTNNPFDNPQFRKELSDLLDEKLRPLSELEKTVKEHEEYINQQKGGGRVLMFIWTGLLGLLSGWLGSKGH